ncbi:MAG: 7,8-didemethyl-8-hydroxy-5-deazariboflavin synthase subunit CofH [Cyanobacteria bacterium P01_A01_bin.37]
MTVFEPQPDTSSMSADAVSALDAVLNRAISGGDISEEDGVLLLRQQDDGAIAAIRQAADEFRQLLVGDTVTYVVNRNINFTNICEQHCSFCAFRRDSNQPGAYWLDEASIIDKTQDAIQHGATEICMQGGLNPAAKLNGRSLDYYIHLIQIIKSQAKDLHLHAFSPQEVEFIAREDNLTYADVILALKEAGVGSMPGTAAEVLDDAVRQILCPEKINTEVWLDIVEAAHRLDMPTTSTMLSGHIETIEQQVRHLSHLRALQQRAQKRGNLGITEFIILPFVGQEAPKPLRKRVGRDQPVLSDALHLTAVARLFLGRWIVNHQPSWVKLGIEGAAKALTWGCNDIGGTLMEEHITTMAGAKGGTCMTVDDLKAAIFSIGRSPQQRDTLYGVVETHLAVS